MQRQTLRERPSSYTYIYTTHLHKIMLKASEMFCSLVCLQKKTNKQTTNTDISIYENEFLHMKI